MSALAAPVLAVLLATVSCEVAAQATVATIAGQGSGTTGVAGHANGIGSAATFSNPVGVCISTADGSIIVGDSGSNEVRQVVVASGVATVSLLTGSAAGTAGNADGTAATFTSPSGVACQSAGALYVLDSGNYRVRSIPAAGASAALVGGGASLSISGPPTNGVGSNAIFNIATNGIVAGAVDELFVADAVNNVIRLVVISTATVSTVSGGGFIGTQFGTSDGVGTNALYQMPNGLARSPSGDIAVADSFNHRVRIIAIASGVYTTTTLAGSSSGGCLSGVGSNAAFVAPMALIYDSTGANLYVSDMNSNTVRAIVVATGDVSLLAGQCNVGGNTDGTAATLSGPNGIAFLDSNTLVFADGPSNLLRTIALLPPSSPSATASSTASSSVASSATASPAASPSASPAATASPTASVSASPESPSTSASVSPSPVSATPAASVITVSATPSALSSAFVSLNISLVYPAGADAAAYSSSNMTAILLALKCDLANISHVAPSSVALYGASAAAPALSTASLDAAEGAATAAGAAGCVALADAAAAIASNSSSGFGRRRRRHRALSVVASANGACASISTASSTLPLLSFNVRLTPSLADAAGFGLGPGASILAAVAAAINSATPSSYALSTAVWSDVTCASFPASPFVVAGVATTGSLVVPTAQPTGLSSSQQVGLGVGIGVGLLVILCLAAAAAGALDACFVGVCCDSCCSVCCRGCFIGARRHRARASAGSSVFPRASPHLRVVEPAGSDGAKL